MNKDEMKDRFVEEYVQEVISLLDISDPHEISKIRQLAMDRYIDTEIQIHNTVNFTDEYISPIDFWYMKDNFILNENGVLNDITSLNEAVTAKLISQYIDFRQMFKRMAKKAGAIGDTINERQYKTFELLTKLRINGFYGLAGYLMGAFFNIDNADTTTTAGRNVIAVSAITNELLYGWFHFYSFEAHMKLISHVAQEDCDSLCSRYTLPLKSVDDIIRHMLGDDYFHGYYKLSALRSRINKLTDNQKRVLYMKNNIMEFLDIPEVSEVMKRIISNVLDDDMTVTFDDGSVSMNPFTHPKIKDDIKLMSDLVQELAFGMYYYEGDYVNGEYKDTLVEIITSIPRRKIANMD